MALNNLELKQYIKYIITGLPIMGIIYINYKVCIWLGPSHDYAYWIGWIVSTLPCYVITRYFVFNELKAPQ